MSRQRSKIPLVTSSRAESMASTLTAELLDDIFLIHYFAAPAGKERTRARASVCLVSRWWRDRAYGLRPLWSDIIVHLWTTRQYVTTSLLRNIGGNVTIQIDTRIVHNYLYDPAFLSSSTTSPIHSIEDITSLLLPLLGDVYSRVEGLSTDVVTSAEWLCLMRGLSKFQFPKLKFVRHSAVPYPGDLVAEEPPILHLPTGVLTHMCLVSLSPPWTRPDAYSSLRDFRLRGYFYPMPWSLFKLILRASPNLETLYLEYVQCSAMDDDDVIHLPSLTRLHVVYADERSALVIERLDTPIATNLRIDLRDGHSLLPLVARCSSLFSRAEFVEFSLDEDITWELERILPEMKALQVVDLRFCRYSALPILLRLSEKKDAKSATLHRITVFDDISREVAATVLRGLIADGGVFVGRLHSPIEYPSRTQREPYREWRLAQESAVGTDTTMELDSSWSLFG
ncbi:hypothetical protein C8F04DRAFT_1199711 [Mycena alexandri]|uniref:F-box domain-containing protein n=1 Tax=Mycena alexandri TaxID=1745969 RepID=A0AAD6WNK2_9AGAR|nr:hypothetical protein C8F04DRAFT_1199711 [Mycena alexandri]